MIIPNVQSNIIFQPDDNIYIITLPNDRIKGTVQRKLRWVESGVNRWVMLQYWSAGHYFLILKGHYRVFRIKRFAATWAFIIGNVGKNWWSAENGV